MLKGKNACKYYSESGPNKGGKGSYDSLCVSKPLVLAPSRLSPLSVFVKGARVAACAVPRAGGGRLPSESQPPLPRRVASDPLWWKTLARFIQ